MVLTEAFAAGTPVVASNIAGYADVVTDGARRRPRPARRPAAPRRGAAGAAASRPSGSPRWARAARESAQRYAWPRVAAQVEGVYERGHRGARARRPRRERVARRIGLVPVRRPRAASARGGCPSLDPEPRAAAERPPDRAPGRRSASPASLGVGAHLHRRAADRRRPGRRRASSAPTSSWVLIATALMMASMFLRASSWFSIAQGRAAAQPAAPPRRRPRRRWSGS